MNGSLGRDRVWNEHIWGEIDKAVREEVGRIRVAQKVFPSTVVNNVLPVVANLVPPLVVPAPPVPAVLRTGDDQFQPFIELSREFTLTQAQVDGEESMHLAPTLARMAASAIAGAEDALLFLGRSSFVPGATPPFIGTGVTVTNQGAIQPGFGFVAVAAANPPAISSSGANSIDVGNIIGAVADGMAALNIQGQPGPYALFLSPKRYAQTFTPPPNSLQAAGDQIKEIVTGGFYMVVSLPDTTGILVSLGGEPTKIILGTDAITAFTYTEQQGDYHFRVFERIQLVVRDGRAFQTLTLSVAAPPRQQAPGQPGVPARQNKGKHVRRRRRIKSERVED
jgi:uncharacterized linocin/CFP29 family protein